MTPPQLPINIPNILTLIRILLTPLFVISLLRGTYGFALFLFAIAAVSDALDGLLARWLNQRTLLGAYLDPIADKLLIAVSYITLAMKGVVPEWLTVLVISRDVLILVGILVFQMMVIELQIRPSIVSKCTTAVQLFTILVILLSPPALVLTPLYWITAGLTIASGLHYVYVGMNALSESSEE